MLINQSVVHMVYLIFFYLSSPYCKCDVSLGFTAYYPMNNRRNYWATLRRNLIGWLQYGVLIVLSTL